MSSWIETTDGSAFFTSAAIAFWVVATGVPATAGLPAAAGAVAVTVVVWSVWPATATMPPATEAPTRAPSAIPAAKRPPFR